MVLTISSLLLVSALLSPTGLYAVLQRLFQALGERIGRTLTRVLMALLFYLVFLPFGLLFRRGRRDRLKRYWEPDAATYWEPHEGITASSGSCERQY